MRRKKSTSSGGVLEAELLVERFFMLAGVDGIRDRSHETWCDKLREMGWNRHGFGRALATALTGHNCRERCRCNDDLDPEETPGSCVWRDALLDLIQGRSPDAWHIDQDGTVRIIEVDLTAETEWAKWQAIAWRIDGDGSLVLRVFAIQKDGVPRLRWTEEDIIANEIGVLAQNIEESGEPPA